MTIKKNYFGFLSLLIIASLFLTTSCENSENNTNSNSTTATTDIEVPGEDILMPVVAVKPPIPGVDVPFTTYKVPVSEGMTIETEKGTTVEIPANAFVDKDGKPVEGVVEVKFREFHDASDIIVSGIPMHNPKTGEFMETGGMFEIQGEQKGEEIFIAAEKKIDVNLASFNEGDDFNFFELGMDDMHWKDEGAAPGEQVNMNKKNRLKLLDKELCKKKPVRPLKKSNVDNRQLFDLDINYSRFPTLKAFSGVVWQYSGQGVDIEKEKWVFETDWDRINIDKSETGFFELKLSNAKKSVTTYIQPVLDGKDYEKALAIFTEKAMKEYEQLVEEQKERRARLSTQANMYRSFSINGFGTYNCDKWGSIPHVLCSAEFTFDEHSGFKKEMLKDITFFLVMKNRNAVIPYKTNGHYKFYLPTEGENSLLAIMPGGRVAMYTANDFANVDVAKVKQSNLVNVDMKTSDTYIESADDLSVVLDYAMAN